MNRQRGMTLLELLVAMILTGIVAGIVLEMIVGEHKNYTVTREKIQLQTDAREAMRIMEEEIKNSGFHNLADYSRKDSLVMRPCTGDVFTNGAYVAEDSTSDGVVLGVILFNPMSGGSSCSDNLWKIEYRWDAKTQVLSRRATKNPAAATFPQTVSAADAKDYVPFLDNVQSFGTAFGIVRDSVALVAPSYFIPSAASPPLVNGNLWTKNDPSIKDSTDAEGKITFKFPDAVAASGPYTMMIANSLPLLGASGSGVAGEGTLNDTATYRISFRVIASPSMDEITGLNGGYINAGFYASALGTPLGGKTIFNFRPSKVTDRVLQYDLSPGAGATQAGFYFGFQVSSLAAGTGRQLTIANLAVARLDKGRVQTWLGASQMVLNPQKMQQVKMLKLGLRVVDSRQKAVSLSRSVQVVNNGN